MNENPVTRIVPQKGSEVIHFTSGQQQVHQQPGLSSRPSSRMTGNEVNSTGSRPSSRMTSCRIPLSSATSLRSSSVGWDSRSIATQTSDEEGGPGGAATEVNRVPQPTTKR